MEDIFAKNLKSIHPGVVHGCWQWTLAAFGTESQCRLKALTQPHYMRPEGPGGRGCSCNEARSDLPLPSGRSDIIRRGWVLLSRARGTASY